MDNLIKNGGGLHNYSTEEHIVGKWIDGSDVYEKTFQVTYPAEASAPTTILTTSDISISKILDYHAFGIRPQGDFRTIPCYYASENYSYLYFSTNTSNALTAVVTIYGSVMLNMSGFITIRYLK